jgi:hypothetical protein
MTTSWRTRWRRTSTGNSRSELQFHRRRRRRRRCGRGYGSHRPIVCAPVPADRAFAACLS